MNVLKLCRSPAPSVMKGQTVRQAVEVMAKTDSGALVVLDGDTPVGIVSERDIVLRAVRNGLSASDTLVERIMTTPIEAVPAESTVAKAIDLMTTRRIRHLLAVDAEGKAAGLLSSRTAFQEHLTHLLDQLLSIESFLGADGPGG